MALSPRFLAASRRLAEQRLFVSTLGMSLGLVVLGAPVAVLRSQATRDRADPKNDPAACGPIDDSWRTTDHARVRPGTYRLTLTTDAPAPRPKSVTGTLWLAPTSSNDRSPAHPSERPSPRDSVRAPLYGSTDVDLFVVDAALQVADLSTESDVPLPVPAPNSWDPLHPGVLALVQREASTGPRQTVLLIGTGANRRAGTPGVDGVGVILRVRRITDAGFEGTWGPYAASRGGAGFFCASRAP